MVTFSVSKYGIEAKLEVDDVIKDFVRLFYLLQKHFPNEIRPKLFATDNALDLTWMAEFMEKMAHQACKNGYIPKQLTFSKKNFFIAKKQRNKKIL